MKFGNKFSILLLGLALGCFVYVGFLVYERYQPQSVTFTQSVASTTGASPDGLIIPKLNISLGVYELVYKRNWPLSKKGIVNLKNSNVFYGHNWPNLLGNLKNISVNDQIQIHYTDNHIRNFKVTAIVTVWSNQADILDQTNSPDIVLYTCIGFLDTQRLVVVATPEN